MIATNFHQFACATCIGQEGQADVAAANGAVFVMIGALAIVFLSILGVLIGFIRRSRRFSEPAPSLSSGNAS